MPHFKFTSDYDFSVRGLVIAYKARGVYLISQAAAKEVLSRGVGFPVARPAHKLGKTNVGK